MTYGQERANAATLVQLFVTFAMSVAIAICVALVAKDVDSPNFWFDESGQYWLAMGQFHYSAAGTPTGSLYDAWNYSQGGNSDPGGFTLVLRMIAGLLGTTPSALRIAPLSFGVAAILLLIYWGRSLRIPLALAIAAPLILLQNQNFLHFTLELRAYSMEFCGVVALFLATVLLLKAPRASVLTVWIAILAVFSLSRYPFVVFAGSACALVLWEIARRRGRDCGILFAALGAALVIYLAIFFGMLRFQSILNGHPFIATFTFKGKSWAEIGAILYRNFLSAFVLPKTVFLVLLPVEMIRRKIRGVDAIDRSTRNALLSLWGFIVIANSGSAFFSSLGRLPWDVNDGRWSLSEYVLGALAVPGVVAILYGWCTMWPARVPTMWRQSIAATVAAAAFLFALITVGRLAVYHRADWEPEQVYPALQSMSDYGGPGGSIILDKGMWPSYRYIIEQSGQRLPPGFKSMTIQVVEFDDLAKVAAAGLALPRPVHFIFATWDRQMKDRLQTELAPHGEVEAIYIDPHWCTNLLTLFSPKLASSTAP